MIRWTQVQPCNVLHLIHKVGIVGNFEMAVAMGLQVEQLEPSVNGGLPDAGVPGQGTTLPWVAWGGGLCNAVLSTSATRWSSWVRVRPGRCSS